MEGAQVSSLEDRKAEIRREIERKARYLETLENMPDFDTLADGTVLGLAVTYGPSRPYSVIAYKSGGFWFATGGRHLRMAQVIAEFEVETVAVFDIGAAMLDAMRRGGL